MVGQRHAPAQPLVANELAKSSSSLHSHPTSSDRSPSAPDARLPTNDDQTKHSHLFRHRHHRGGHHSIDHQEPDNIPPKADESDSADDFIIVEAQTLPEEIESGERQPLELRDSRRDLDLDPAKLVAQVIQTISLVHIIDGKGSIVSTATQMDAPNTYIVDKSGNTISSSHPESTSMASSQTVISTTHVTSAAPSFVAASAPSGGLPYSTNGTFTAGNATAYLNGSSRPYPYAPTTRTNTSIPKYLLYSDSTHQPTRTPGLTILDVPSSAPTIDNGAGSSSHSQDDSSAGVVNLSPQQKQMIGGVVGGVTGVAFLAMLVLLLLRYKRKNGNGISLGDGGADNSRALPSASNSSEPNPMAERNAASAAVGAALASLTGPKRPSPQPLTGGSERSFYRVSGRKLPSVLTAGGDGYTDPRASVASGHSDYSQGSQASDPFNPAESRFALGSPMRPVSGIPIMRSGPARTPLAEANPFADPPPPSPPVSSYHDSPPRSVGSRSSHRGSRFQERM